MAKGKSFYGIKIGPNTALSPQGYLIFQNAVIARTGSQTYKGSELPQRTSETPADEVTAQDLGYGPDDLVTLYRPADEVFDPATIASFEGQIITDEHPGELVSVDTVSDINCGHIMNVRKGSEPLPNGDWPLLADGMIVSKPLIDKINSGIRDLSCGYNYRVKKSGNLLLQTEIVGNHVAVVPNGRAGVAAIKDSALPVTTKPIQREKENMATLMERIFGIGFKQYAADATPADVAAAVTAMGEKKAAAKDADEHVKGCRCTDCMPVGKDEFPPKKEEKKDEKATATDAARERVRAKAIAAVDAALAEGDLEAIHSLLAPGSKVSKETPGLDAEEETEKEQEAQKETAKEEKTEGADEEPEEPEAMDDESPIIEPVDRPKPMVPAAVDGAAVRQAVAKALKDLKPFIAASNDRKLRGTFDSIVGAHNASVRKAGNGTGYKVVAKAATARDASVERQNTNQHLSELATVAYAEAAQKMSLVK